MNGLRIYMCLLPFIISVSCKAQQVRKDSIVGKLLVVNDSTFVNTKNYTEDLVYDMRYATENNFLNAKVYDCAECYLRYRTVVALVKANEAFQKLGYSIKIFDCYRPLDVQKKMWEIVPNPAYVANPAKGSIHNRGGAVDITLVDVNNVELDMGTSFDFFGKEAAHEFNGFSKTVLDNRKLLKTIMEANGFKALPSEWWHYDIVSETLAPVANFKWECD